MMHSITLRDLMTAWNGRPNVEPYTEDTFTRMIDGIGQSNAHIAFPTSRELLRQNHYERIDPLKWETLIFGDYIYLEYKGHDPALRLHAVSTLSEAKDAILRPAGFLNIWTDDVMVLEFGKRRDFAIHYIDRYGDAKVFCKEAPNQNSRPIRSARYTTIRYASSGRDEPSVRPVPRGGVIVILWQRSFTDEFGPFELLLDWPQSMKFENRG